MGVFKKGASRKEVASSPLLVCTARAGGSAETLRRNSLPEQNYEVKEMSPFQERNQRLFLSMLCSLCDLSAPTRDLTRGPWQ